MSLDFPHFFMAYTVFKTSAILCSSASTFECSTHFSKSNQTWCTETHPRGFLFLINCYTQMHVIIHKNVLSLLPLHCNFQYITSWYLIWAVSSNPNTVKISVSTNALNLTWSMHIPVIIKLGNTHFCWKTSL